jgi:2'-hydroxyisoflavone reductase
VGALRVLVIGGTGFVGRGIVDALVAGGHEPTLFNRGRHRLFPGVNQLIGDRSAGDYRSLAGGAWDAVVDVIGYLPREVDETIEVLGDRVGRYLFISSHAVFDGPEPHLRPAIRHAGLPLTDETYGPSKVACEQDIRARYGPRATIVRPGKVAGPHDNQRGLTYWVRRAARGGLVALPGNPEQPVQIVDVRDVARLVVDLLVLDRGGAFTAVGPSTPFAELIQTCAAVAGSSVTVVPVPAVGRFPLVKTPEQWTSQRREPAAEMHVTPLEETVRDVLAWDRGRGEPPLGYGFTDAEEARALASA